MKNISSEITDITCKTVTCGMFLSWSVRWPKNTEIQKDIGDLQALQNIAFLSRVPADFKTARALQVDPHCTRGLPKGLLAKLGNWAAVTQAGMSDPGYIPDWTGVTWVLPQCQWLQIASHRSHQLCAFCTAWVCKCILSLCSACLFCFRQSIKEQNSAHNCLCMGFPGTQHLWQVCFGDYRFWHRLGALLECQSRVRGEDVTEMMSICRRRGKKKELVEGKALGNYRFWIPDKGKPTTGSEPSVFWNIYAIICSKDSG